MARRIEDKVTCTKWLVEQPLVRAYAQLYPSVIPGLERALNSANPDAARAIAALLSAARLAECDKGKNLTNAFRLSPVEAQLATHVSEGGTLASYAKLRRVTIETARSQLRSVFAKMGVRRQAEMVAIVVKQRGQG